MSEVVAINRASDLANLARNMRELADDIESGKLKPRTLIVVMDERETSTLTKDVYGYVPRPTDEIGMLVWAQHKVLERFAEA